MARIFKGLVIVSAALAVVAVPLSSRWGVFSSVAEACSCAPPPAPSAARDVSAVVFLGKVTAVSPPSATATVKFSVERVYKGDVPPVVVALTTDGAACGLVGLKPDERWLVYSFEASPIRLDSCSRTRLASGGASDFADLGPGHPPVAFSAVESNSATPVSSSGAVPSPRPRGCAGCASVHEKGRSDAVASFLLGGVLLLCRLRRRSVSRPIPASEDRA